MLSVSLLLLGLVVGNIYLSARLSSDGEALRSLEQKATALRHENQMLEQRLVTQQSLTKLEPEAKQLGFVSRPTSLIISPDEPVAQLIEAF
jgi:hypothetical protein